LFSLFHAVHFHATFDLTRGQSGYKSQFHAVFFHASLSFKRLTFIATNSKRNPEPLSTRRLLTRSFCFHHADAHFRAAESKPRHERLSLARNYKNTQAVFPALHSTQANFQEAKNL
jgi:hypothetical protein